MTPDERTLLTGFFDRLGQVPAVEKDAEADGLIREAVGRDPDLAYRMAQTALVYEQGLASAQEEIRRLQAQLQSRQQANLPASAGGSFLGAVPRVPMAGAARAVPGGGMFNRSAPGGGQGFLASAMSTALGVAGGMALFSGLEHMFGGGTGDAMAQDGSTGGDAAAGPAGPWGNPADPDGTAPGDGARAGYEQADYDRSGFEDPGHDGSGFDGGGFDGGGFDL